MEIVAYTNPGCSHCTTIKKLFRRAEVEYTEVSIGRDISFQLFKEKFPSAGGYPYVVIDGKEIGGLVETAKLFLEKGLVDPPKK
jgi:glutaredoxin 3